MSFPARTPLRSWFFTLALLVGAGSLGLASIARANPARPAVISLHVGQSAAVTQTGMSKLAVESPSIAAVRPAGADTAEVTGVSEGKTLLYIWDGSDHRTTYRIEVTR